jgi:hypothetical protein
LARYREVEMLKVVLYLVARRGEEEGEEETPYD